MGFNIIYIRLSIMTKNMYFLNMIKVLNFLKNYKQFHRET